jgi:uncharacterized ubiquitin-like protein YukD
MKDRIIKYMKENVKIDIDDKKSLIECYKNYQIFSELDRLIDKQVN